MKDFLFTGEELLEGYSTDGEVEEVTAPSTWGSDESSAGGSSSGRMGTIELTSRFKESSSNTPHSSFGWKYAPSAISSGKYLKL